MKCSKCKEKITLKDAYCGGCGVRTNQEEYRKKRNKKICKIGIVSVILVFFLSLAIMLILYFTSAKYVALKYFKTIKNGNLEEIYSYLKDAESLFVSKEILEEKESGIQNIEEERITKIYEDGGRTYVEFSYTLNGKETRSYVELKKKTYFHAFNTYKVVSGKLVSNIEFKVPKNSIVTIDGKDITSYLQKNTKGDFDTYYIQNMIKGDYEVKVMLANGLTMQEEVSVEDNHTYTITHLELEEEKKNILEKTSLTLLNILYDAALKKQEYATIASSFTQSVESFYRQIKRSINSSNITNVKYTDCEVKNISVNQDGNLEVKLLLDSTYQIQKEDAVETKSGAIYKTLTYTYENEEFVLIG